MTNLLPDVDLFWAKVNKDGPIPAHAPDLGPCWVWTAARYPRGYGMIGMRQGGRQFMFGAHRVAWEYANGPIPDGLFVCHRCDNKPCVRADHLVLGTARENSADAAHKGLMAWKANHVYRTDPARIPQGERLSKKLREVDVVEILRRCASGESPRSVAPSYAMSESGIRNIRDGKRWKHVPR